MYSQPMRKSVRATERATARIEVRWKPSERAQIEEAAKLTGEPLTVIVVNGALREAARLVREAKRAKEDPAGA